MLHDQSYTIENRQFDVDMHHAVQSAMNRPMCAAACRECPNFGTVWTCPPFDADNPVLHPEQFGRLRLYVSRITFVRRANPNVFYVVRDQIADQLRRDNSHLAGLIYGFAGRCDLCPAGCARVDGKPCRHPDLAVPSLEGVGFDVGALLHNFCGMELEWSTPNNVAHTLTYVAGIAYTPK